MASFVCNIICMIVGHYITGYGSTLYIGIAMVFVYSHTFGNSVLTFNFKLF